MKRIYLAALAAPLALAALAGAPAAAQQSSTTFTVTIENVSQPGTLDTDRAGGTVPLSPGPFAVFQGENPMFSAGAFADAGTELIAEDGFPMTKLDALTAASNVSTSGLFEAPGGPDDGPAIFAGESATFTFTASPGDRLTFETMFVQSNDWFYGDDGSGIALFTAGGAPISGDITSQVVLWDAGTEEDTAPGTGPNQKPVQDPSATNVGPDEDVVIELATTRHPSFDIPANASVIRVTIAAEQPQPTPTATQPPAQPTATPVAPQAPDTGTGTTGDGRRLEWLGLAIASLLAGAGVLTLVSRRSGR